MKRVSEYRVTWSGEGEYVATCPEHPEITGHSREPAQALQALVDSTRKGRPEWRGECSQSPRGGHSVSWLDGRYCSWCGVKGAKQSEQRLWPLAELRERLAGLCASAETSPDETKRLDELVGELHDVCLTYGLHDMLAPQVAIDAGEVELTWMSVRRKRTVSFSCGEGHVTMLWLDDARGEDVASPSRESIAEKLEWVTGRAGLDDHSPG